MYTGSIRRLIQIYKTHFTEQNEKVRICRGSVQNFQDQWDLEARDFCEMLKKALPRRSARPADEAAVPPIDQLHRLAAFRPEGVRRLFRLLFQDNMDFQTARFAEIIGMFKKASQRLYAEYKPDGVCGQNEQATMYYLTLKYPDRFTFFSPSCFERLYKAANIRFYQPKGISDIGKIQLHLRLVELIRHEIRSDPELVAMAHEAVGAGEYPDPGHWLLAQDVAASLKSEVFVKAMGAPATTRPRNLLIPKSHEKSELRVEIGMESETERIYLDAAILLVRETEQQQVNRFCTHFEVIPDGVFKGREIGYSIRSLSPDMKPLYILVKATPKGFFQPVKLTPEEIAFSEAQSDRFKLFHIYNFDPFGDIMTANVVKFDGSLAEIAMIPKAVHG